MDRKLADRKAYEYMKMLTGPGGSTSGISNNQEMKQSDEVLSRSPNGRQSELQRGTQVEGSITGGSSLSTSMSMRDKFHRAFT